MKKNPLSPILNCIGLVFASLFGKLKWNSPPWLRKTNRKAQNSPKTFWSVIAVIVAVVLSTNYGIQWYKNRPQPVYVTAFVTVPDITPNDETLVPNNLAISFNILSTPQSVAPINLIGKKVMKGITMTPTITGDWVWSTDSQLLFTPSEDWPAGQKYDIQFEPDFFATSVTMEKYNYSFTTHPFHAAIAEFKFYQDPVNPKAHNAVATIDFNYPVNSESLEKNTSLMFQELIKGKLKPNAETLKFSYNYDDHKRIAYLHSDTIKIQEVARYLLLSLNKEISSSTNSAHLEENASLNLLIPDTGNFFKIASTTASIVRNNRDRPEQILNIETSLGVDEKEFNQSVHMYLLPADYPANVMDGIKKNYQWSNPGEVSQYILSLATPLVKEAIPTEQNYASLHSFKLSAPTPRYIYIKIDKGMRGFGDFVLLNNYAAIMAVPPYPTEINFLHKGSLLALSGEKKLSVLTRGVGAVKFNFARVLPDNINQLITQTQGDFNNPYFINPSFNQQNISQISSEIQQFDTNAFGKQQYTALDLGKYLTTATNTAGPQGLFLVQATSWDTANNTPLDVTASRLVLITDLGMLVKDNIDGTHDVFVSSITQGAQVADVAVTVLGKNGLPVLTRVTDVQGRANFPSLNDFVEDREPVVYLAKLSNDVSFIPYNNFTRQLNFSKFDTGGMYTNNQDAQTLSAFLFSDRGIYRPGDTVHIGMVVKQAFAQAQPPGLPLEVTVVDARGTTIKDEKITLNDPGYMALDFTTNSSSPTGTYMVNLYLAKDNRAQNLLGSTSVKISEFLPDRMKITSSLSPTPADGWISPVGLKAQVGLWNLYGAPATDRRISAKILLNPQQIDFKDYPDYIFADPSLDPKKPARAFSEDLNNAKTDDKGSAEFNLNLERFENATYEITFFAEGFEADGGRSVTTQIKTLVSPLAYFIGYKPDGDLSFIKQNSARSVNYIAVNPQLNEEEVRDLKLQLISLHPVTTLVKKPDGTYQYQSIMQSTIVSTTPINIAEAGLNYPLPTQEIGDYSLVVLDKNDTILNQLKFSIVGASQLPLAKNAELSLKLSKEEYKAGEDIELQITAPYTGSGLITIERDKVFSTQWFKTDSTSSMQTIHIPDDFQGDGYVNVAFIRNWDSPELFISPLSYSVVPFTVNHEAHDIKITLKTPKVAKPGEPFTIEYNTDKPGKIIVYAVDEGILQVADYDTPDPLSFFFQKHALEVATQQTVDQILPEFIQDRELSAAGGDDSDSEMASHLNPFKRKTDLPVVFWSGIIDATTTTQQLVYQVPDYFNGSLRVMAVAVSPDSMGANDTAAEIRGDFIINPNVPAFVAPKDEFEVSASIANNIKDSGDHTEVQVNLLASPEIEILESDKQILEISEGHEKVVRFKLKAKSALGAAKVTFKTSAGDKNGAMDATLSVRPANPLTTEISSGQSKEVKKTLNITQTFYPQYRNVDATLSTSPLTLVYGLQHYLDNYPYGCTEQLTSKALPLIAMKGQPWFAKDNAAIDDQINRTIEMLSQRQMSSGGFSYWPGLGENQGNTFASVYAMHFLTEAGVQGYNVSNDMFYNGLAYLKNLASTTSTDLQTARNQAYAIYILTRNEIVTTNYLANLQLYLQKADTKAWQNDITAVYIAASYQLLKSYDDANELIKHYQPQSRQSDETDFYDSDIADAQYLYIVAKHFPALLDKIGDQLLMHLVATINNGEINTVLSGYSSLALGAYPLDSSGTNTALSITETLLDKQEKSTPANNGIYQKLDIGTEVVQISLNNPEKQRYFYQLTQSGFDKTLPTTPTKAGIEIFRDYRDEKGNIIQSTTLGSEIEVHLQIRAINNQYLTNIAIEDLLPGGFEVVRDSVKSDLMDYFDVREDRVNFFGTVDSSAKEIVYKIKAINTGIYTVPAPFAESMYNPAVKTRGIAAKISVTAAD